MPETTPLIKAALNLRGGAGFDVYIYVIYIFYADSIENFIKKWRMFLTSNTISISDAIDLFEFISILFIIGYIFIDVRHKSNGYAEIRVERFKELFEMEEKLLNILRKMNYSLKNNIEVIVERKSYILSSGAEILTGKKCYISGDTIRYDKKEYWRNWHSNDKYFQLKRECLQIIPPFVGQT